MEGSKGAREGNFKGGILRRALASIQFIHRPSHNAALAIDTLLLQMKNSDLLIALSRCRRNVIHVSFACAIPVYIIHVVA